MQTLPKKLSIVCIFISYCFVFIFYPLLCRNPFCKVAPQKKAQPKNRSPLRLLAVTAIDNSSSKIAVIQNHKVIGHYRLGDQIQNYFITEITHDWVTCKELNGKKTIIYP